MVRYYLVKGRVQGVGFRWFVQREAAELGLRGWVRNTDAGHVEVVASGEPGNVPPTATLSSRKNGASNTHAAPAGRLDRVTVS